MCPNSQLKLKHWAAADAAAELGFRLKFLLERLPVRMRFNGQPRPRGAGGARVWDSCSLWAPPFRHFPPHCPSVPPASSSFPRLVNRREGSHRQLRFLENDRMRSVKSGLILRPFLCWGLVRGQADDEGADAVPRASQSRRGDSQMLLERSGVVCAGNELWSQQFCSSADAAWTSDCRRAFPQSRHLQKRQSRAGWGADGQGQASVRAD